MSCIPPSRVKRNAWRLGREALSNAAQPALTADDCPVTTPASLIAVAELKFAADPEGRTPRSVTVYTSAAAVVAACAPAPAPTSSVARVSEAHRATAQWKQRSINDEHAPRARAV